MKIKVFIFILLLSIVIFGITLGAQNLPLWAYFSIVLLSSAGLVFYCAKMLSDEKAKIYDTFSMLQDLQQRNTDDLIQHIQDQQCVLMNTISSNVNLFNQQIKDLTNSLKEESIKNIGIITNEIETEAHNINEKIDKQQADTENIKENLQSSSTSISQLIITSISKIDNQGKDIHSIAEREGDSIKDLINTIGKTATTDISNKIDNFQQYQYSSFDQLSQAVKELNETLAQKIDSVAQQATALQESVVSTETELLKKSDFTNQTISASSNEIKELLTNKAAKLGENINNEMSSAVATLQESIDKNKNATALALENLSQAGKKQNEVLAQKIDSVAQQATVLQESIASTETELSSKSDSINQTISASSNEIKELLINNEAKLSENILKCASNIDTVLTSKIQLSKQSIDDSLELMSENNEKAHDMVQQQIANIERQNAEITSLISNSIKDSDAATENFLNDVEEQYAKLHRNISSVQILVQNIEKAVSSLSMNERENHIIQAIGSVVSDIKSELNIAVAEINDQLLDSQISQEHIKSDIEKLQVLIRTMMKGAETQSENPSIKSNPNRIESITDKESNNVVQNEYKNGHLIKSTMKDSNGIIIYELEYDNNKIKRSRNYDSKGKLNNEQIFYENGQVHYRYEYGKNGKLITEFDQNGKKK